MKITALLSRYFHTIRHLKLIQIRYQLFYLLRRKLGWSAKLAHVSTSQIPPQQTLQLQASIPSYTSYLGQHHFSFLNITHQFGSTIDWNYAAYGKLWTYNLNYFEFLSQADFDKETGLFLIRDFIKNESNLKDGLEPFPIALRTIFWIKFLSKHQIQDKDIHRFLFLQIKLLSRQLEYHLMGNHLLENGFALLFGAYYFSNQAFYFLAKKILTEQLEEQILSDGAHFERSPMYHQLMLYRLLDSINLVQHHSATFENNLLHLFQDKAVLMLAWLQTMMLTNGTIPHFNDSTNNIAPSPRDLLTYAARLNLYPKKISLKDSNYRKHTSSNYEIIVDIGNIGADYIPGHAHSDSLHFVLHYRDRPLLVDTGTSTYEKNVLRTQERSTAAHNTVKINQEEQSDVWGGFRVGRRVKTVEVKETPTSLIAIHDAYRHLKIQHQRTFSFENYRINIEDKISPPQESQAYFHFHPSVKLELRDNTLFGDFGIISFDGTNQIVLKKYNYATGFNVTQEAYLAVITFKEHLHTKIELK